MYWFPKKDGLLDIVVTVSPVPLKWQCEQFGAPGLPANPAFPVLTFITKANDPIAIKTNDARMKKFFFKINVFT